MLQYDTLSANNEITAIFRQDGGKPTPQLLYCRCLTTPDRKSSNTDIPNDSGDDSFDIIDNCSDSDKEIVIKDSISNTGTETANENVEKTIEKDNDKPKDDNDQKVYTNDLQYAEVAKVEEASKEDHEQFDSIIQEQKKIIMR